ncbi:MAG: hypothetical protein COW84_03885 [Gammaproteobacteria bacterium CG22_combo_CG10-13_8_21_14_all_40_8]|nr:MAG: hypothetical protein COW84_03885 [Gammaproteobacteria bacterium CG22_combo_CG10-13_8_21_14_all_40_8]
MSHSKLASLFSRDLSLKTTTLSESFSWHEYLEKNKKEMILLFYMSAKNLIKPFSVDEFVSPQAG